MDELHRLNYLEALGVQQWVPRVPLLNARDSEFAEAFELVPAELVEKVSLENPSLVGETANTTQHKTESLPKNAVSGDAVSGDSVPAMTTSTTTAPVVEPKSVESTHLQNTGEQAASLETGINFEVYGRNKAYALLVEKEQSKALSQIETGLLNNILKALDKLAKASLDDSNTQMQNSFREVFTWPMFESLVEPDTIKGQQAMHDALNAFVSASIKRHQHSVLIISGAQLEHLVDQQFLGAGIKMLTVPTLHEMASTPERKAEIWQILLGAFHA